MSTRWTRLTPRRIVIVAVAAVGAAAVIAGAVTAQAAVVGATVTQPFSADSGDPCRMGQTRGDLGWHSDSPRSVDVTGVVADRPLPGTAAGACQDDGRYTLTTFTGYSNGSQITQSALRVDNGHRDVQLRLTAPRSIDLVVVRVPSLPTARLTDRVRRTAALPGPDHRGRLTPPDRPGLARARLG